MKKFKRCHDFTDPGLMRLHQLGMILTLFAFCACSSGNSANGKAAPTPIPAAKLQNGTWVPSVVGAGNGNYKQTVTVTKTVFNLTGVPLVRLDDAWGSNEVTVDLGTFASSDFGANGSISLEAETQNYPFSGGAYAVLSSFYVNTGASTIEFVNLTGGCQTSGMWSCQNGSCDANLACNVQTASGFGNRNDWDQHQVPPYGYSTTNLFPRCDQSVNGWSSCPANLSSLPAGHYFAKYILLSDEVDSVDDTTVGLKVSAFVKKDTQARGTSGSSSTGAEGAINYNVILVGDQNINDSHTAKGAQNLNLLFQEVNQVLMSNANLGLGSIQVYEWTNANGGDQYSQVDYSRLGILFASGSQGVPAATSGNFLNIFLVSDISYTGGATVLGLSGAILGGFNPGSQQSGLAFTSANQIGSFNPYCSLSTCSRDLQDASFLEMAATIAHETGHFLGLNHPSERPNPQGAQVHDQLSDTPQCLSTSSLPTQRDCYRDTVSTLNATTCQAACDAAIATATGSSSQHYYNSGTATDALDTPANFCMATQECQFNHLMWYTTKHRDESTGIWREDGNLISSQSNAILQWDPFVR